MSVKPAFARAPLSPTYIFVITVDLSLAIWRLFEALFANLIGLQNANPNVGIREDRAIPESPSRDGKVFSLTAYFSTRYFSSRWQTNLRIKQKKEAKGRRAQYERKIARDFIFTSYNIHWIIRSYSRENIRSVTRDHYRFNRWLLKIYMLIFLYYSKIKS